MAVIQNKIGKIQIMTKMPIKVCGENQTKKYPEVYSDAHSVWTWDILQYVSLRRGVFHLTLLKF